MGPSTTVERYENIFDADDFDSEFVDFVEEQGDLWTLPVGEFFGSTITYKKQCAGQFTSKEEELFQYKHSRKDQFKLSMAYHIQSFEVTDFCLLLVSIMKICLYLILYSGTIRRNFPIIDILCVIYSKCKKVPIEHPHIESIGI